MIRERSHPARDTRTHLCLRKLLGLGSVALLEGVEYRLIVYVRSACLRLVLFLKPNKNQSIEILLVPSLDG